MVSGYFLALTLFLCVMFGCPISSIPEIYTEVSSSWFISYHLTGFFLLCFCFIEMVLFFHRPLEFLIHSHDGRN